MTLSPDVILWVIGALFSQLTVCIHLLISILKGLQVIKTEQALQNQRLNYIEQESDNKK